MKVKLQYKKTTGALVKYLSKKIASKTRTVKHPTEVSTSCFSREEFLLDLFSKKGTVK